MYKKPIFFMALSVLILGISQASLAEMSSDGYAITKTVISGGGSVIISENFKMNSTLAQSTPLMDSSAPPVSTEYSLFPGFWYSVEIWIIEPCEGDLDFDDDIDGQDLAILAGKGDIGEIEALLSTFAVQFGDFCLP